MPPHCLQTNRSLFSRQTGGRLRESRYNGPMDWCDGLTTRGNGPMGRYNESMTRYNEAMSRYNEAMSRSNGPLYRCNEPTDR